MVSQVKAFPSSQFAREHFVSGPIFQRNFKITLKQLRHRAGKFIHRLGELVGGSRYGGPTASVKVSVHTPDIRPTECLIEDSEPYAWDWLGREDFGSGLRRLTTYGSGSGSILVDGAWGVGKTTFLRMWTASMRKEGRPVVEINAWKGDYADAPFDNIVLQFERELVQFGKLHSKWKRAVARIPLLLTVALFEVWAQAHGIYTLVLVANVVKALRQAARSSPSEEQRMNNLKANLGGAARRHWKKSRNSLVLVIDELDRCRPDYALRFLETMKHVFEVDYVTFVVGANAQELAYAVTGVYGADFDGAGYIERFFDIKLPLPIGDRRKFIHETLKDARWESSAGKEITLNIGSQDISAEDFAAELLEHTNLGARQIKKALKHIAITLLFNRPADDEVTATIVMLGLVRHVSIEAYQAINRPEIHRGDVFNLMVSSLGVSANDRDTVSLTKKLLSRLMERQPTSSSERNEGTDPTNSQAIGRGKPVDLIALARDALDAIKVEDGDPRTTADSGTS